VLAVRSIGSFEKYFSDHLGRLHQAGTDISPVPIQIDFAVKYPAVGCGDY